jgi:hypothetical protein
MSKDKVTYMHKKEIINYETGEITQEENLIHIKNSQEPNYIKLYIDCLLCLKELSKTFNPILLEFLKHMSYASTSDNIGGQIIYVNSLMKKNIAKRLNITVKRIEQGITQFVKSNIFKRIGTGTYQVNPDFFGKGEWKDIKNIKANFDFGKVSVKAEIIK